MIQRKFIIDINRCIGCNACSVSCKDRARLPDELDYLRVERNESGKYPNVDMFYRVIHCFHCENPSCQYVCDDNAISKNKEGFVLLDVDKCTGCGSCISVCPFESIVQMEGNIFRKCDGCHDEVEEGLDPTCVRACLTRALSFKTIDEKESIDRLEENFNDYGIGPAVIYLKKRKLKRAR